MEKLPNVFRARSHPQRPENKEPIRAMAALLEGKKIRITFTAELYKHDVIEGVCKTVTALQPDSRGDPTRFALSFKIGNGLYVFDVSTQDGITADSIEGSYQPGGRYKIQVLN